MRYREKSKIDSSANIGTTVGSARNHHERSCRSIGWASVTNSLDVFDAVRVKEVSAPARKHSEN